MACFGNAVCFKCLRNVRRPTYRHVFHHYPELFGEEIETKCPGCGESLVFLGPSMKIPPKTKKKEWRELEKFTVQRRKEIHEWLKLRKVQVHHKLEKEVEKLRQRPRNKDRERAINELLFRMEDLT